MSRNKANNESPSISLSCVDLGAERVQLPHWTQSGGPGADPAPTWSNHWRAAGRLVSLGAAQWVEDPDGLLFFLVWLTHTPGSAVPHNYTKGTSLKMLILPLTHFGLRATVPTSPGSGARPMTHMPPPLPNKIASQIEVDRALVNLGIALERTLRRSWD